MKHHLIRILHILRHITPDAKQKAEFRHALVLRVHADTAHERMSRRAKPSSVFSFFRLAPTTAGVIAAAVILGTGGVSFAAQNALPGERLYPVKLATERARLAMVGDKAEKTKLRLTFASRRLDEVDKLIEKNGNQNVNADAALAQYEKALSESESALEENQEKASEIAIAINDAAEIHQRVIQKLSDKIEKLPSAASLKEPLENAREKTEERENSALIAIVSATSTQPDLIPERFVKKSREKVQKRERNLREAALSVEKAMLEGRDVKGADEKIKNAQSIIDRAREDLDRGEIRASLEQSMEAEKITKEIRRFERKREREKEREEKETESRRNEDALDEKH